MDFKLSCGLYEKANLSKVPPLKENKRLNCEVSVYLLLCFFVAVTKEAI